MEELFSLYSDIPDITAVDINFTNDKFLLGLKNGTLIEWDVISKKILRTKKITSNSINTIGRSSDNDIVVGAHNGKIIVTPYNNFNNINILQQPGNNARSRVWRSLWVDNDKILITSNYGLIKVYKKEDTKWSFSTTLPGHGSNAIFGVGKIDDDIISTGDWFGNIIIWLLNNGDFESIQKLQISQAVEDFAWYNDELFAVINKYGRIYLFEKIGENEWNLVYEISRSSTMGKSIHITLDGKYIFGATESEIIQFDTETHQFVEIEISNVVKISSHNDELYIVTNRDIFKRKIEKVPVREDLIKYKYLKISLIGHTGVGKSALCSYITTGDPGDADSTYGRTVWDWVHTENGSERRVLFHDHGGQETAISTFLPFISDSDVILILFQQNDNHTLSVAYDIYESIKDNIGENKNIFFVQTHIDHGIAELNDRRLNELIKDGVICDNIEVCPKNGKGIDEFKKILLDGIFWDKSRTMIQSKYEDSVLKVIVQLQKEKISVLNYKKFIYHYERINEFEKRIPIHHLKYILQN